MTEPSVGPDSVFISYAREDAAFAGRLATELRHRGVDVWMDTNLRGGALWDQEIQGAIRACGKMIVVLSPHSVESAEVADEWSFALEDGDLVIPVLHEPCEVPYRLRLHQRVDFTSAYAEAFERLFESVSARGSPSSEPVARTEPPRRPVRRALGTAALVAAAFLIAAALWRVLSQEPLVTSEPAAGSGARPALGGQAADAPISGEQLIERYRTTTDSRSRFLAARERWLAAAESFEEAERRDVPKSVRARYDSRAHFCRGRHALLAGELTRAEKEFGAAVQADGSWAPPYVELAGLLTRLGRYPEAHAVARKAQRTEPDFWLARVVAGPIYAAEGKFHDAIRTYEELAQGPSALPLVQGNLALAYHAARLHDERALALAEEALERDRDLAPALLVLAERALEAHDAERARGYSQRLVDTAVFDVSAWLVHGDVMLAMGDGQAARAAFQRAVSEFERTRRGGAPPERLEAVRTALADSRLPEPRFAPNTPARVRSRPAEAPRSFPAPAPQPKPKPPRARPEFEFEDDSGG